MNTEILQSKGFAQRKPTKSWFFTRVSLQNRKKILKFQNYIFSANILVKTNNYFAVDSK